MFHLVRALSEQKRDKDAKREIRSNKSASLGYGGALNDDGVFSTASALVFVLLNLQFLLGKKHF